MVLVADKCGADLWSAQQPMTNWFANFGLCFETALVAILSYFRALNLPLGTRSLAAPHFLIPSFSFFVVIFFYDEWRKYLLREGMLPDEKTGKRIYEGWIVRNTYY